MLHNWIYKVGFYEMYCLKHPDRSRLISMNAYYYQQKMEPILPFLRRYLETNKILE